MATLSNKVVKTDTDATVYHWKSVVLKADTVDNNLDRFEAAVTNFYTNVTMINSANRVFYTQVPLVVKKTKQEKHMEAF